MRTSSLLSALSLALVGLLPGCAGDEPGAGQEVGTLELSWGQDGAAGDLVTEVRVPPEGLLLATPAERDVWLDSLPDALREPGATGSGSVADLDAADLEDEVLVVGSFPSCTEQGMVLLDPDTEPVSLWFHVDRPEDGYLCEWSPVQLQVWSVPLAEIGGEAPDHLRDPSTE